MSRPSRVPVKTVYHPKEKYAFRANISFLITILPWYSSTKENTDIFFLYTKCVDFLMSVCLFTCRLSIYIYIQSCSVVLFYDVVIRPNASDKMPLPINILFQSSSNLPLHQLCLFYLLRFFLSHILVV